MLHTLQQYLQSITLYLPSPIVYRQNQALTLLDVIRLSSLPTEFSFVALIQLDVDPPLSFGVARPLGLVSFNNLSQINSLSPC